MTSGPRIYVWCVALAILTIAVYFPSIFHPFVNLDDTDYVTENPHVQDGLSPSTIAWAFTSTDASNWHPVTWLSHALDCQIYGLDPQGHHLTNVLLHAFNVILLFLILYWATGARWRSATVAALFAVHPFNVESVAWIAERKNLLSTFFFFLALAAYGRYARRPSWGRYLLVAILFGAGLAAKPMLVTLPFVLLLLDYWPLGRIENWTEPSHNPQYSWSRLVLEKLPLLPLSAGSSVITMIAQQGAVPESVTFPLKLENALYSYANYIVKIFWPVNLAVIYPHPMNRLSVLAVSASAVFLVGVSLLLWRWRQRYPFAIVSWLWFLGTLVPVIGIVQVGVQAMADRYMYLPAIGIFVLLVWGGYEWVKSQTWLTNVQRAPVLKTTAGLALLALTMLTIRQIGYWRDPVALWTHTIEITHDNFAADDHLGTLLVQMGRIAEANRLFEVAARIAPLDPISHTGLAAAAEDRGNLQEAIRNYKVALRSRNDGFLALNNVNLGVVYREVGDYAAARQYSEEAVKHDPRVFQIMIQQSEQVLQSAPSAPGYMRLGFLFEGAGQIQNAELAFKQALQSNSNFGPARKALQEINQAR